VCIVVGLLNTYELEVVTAIRHYVTSKRNKKLMIVFNFKDIHDIYSKEELLGKQLRRLDIENAAHISVTTSDDNLTYASFIYDKTRSGWYQNQKEVDYIKQYIRKFHPVEKWENPINNILQSINLTLPMFITPNIDFSSSFDQKSNKTRCAGTFLLKVPSKLLMKDPKLFSIVDLGVILQDVTHIPKIDIFRTESTWILQVDLPGLDEDDVQVVCNEQKLILSRATKMNVGIAYELRDFIRKISLPLQVDVSVMEKQMNNGVLTIRFPLRKE